MSVGPMEIVIVLAIAILIFGPRQIPKMGRALGETIREFRGVGRELRGGPWDGEPTDKKDE